MELNPKSKKYRYLIIIFILAIVFFCVAAYNKSVNNKIVSISKNIMNSLDSAFKQNTTKDSPNVSNILTSDRLYEAIDIKDDALLGTDNFKAKILSNEVYFEFAKSQNDSENNDLSSQETTRPFWIRSTINNAQSKQPDHIDREIIFYNEIFPGIDIKQYLYNNRIKEELIVKEKQYLQSFSYTINHSDNLTLILKDNKLLFNEANTNETLAEAQSPFAIDSKGIRYDLTFKLNNNTLSLEYPDNINNASFPLTIDPSYLVKSSATTASKDRVIARDSDGNLHVAYMRKYNNYDNIMYAKSENNGQNWTETVLTSDSTNYAKATPLIAIDSDDNIHIVWGGQHSGSASYRQIRYIKHDGNSWGSIQDLTSGNYNQFANSMVIDSNDNIHIVWDGTHSGSASYRQIRYIKYDGSSWGSIQNLTSGNYNQYGGSIAIDSNNNMHIAWHGTHSSSTYPQIRYIKYDGSSWGSIQNLTSGNYESFPPELAVDSDDNIHIVWFGFYSGSASYKQIRYIKYDGSSWGSIQNLTSGNYDQYRPSVSFDDNNIHVVWHGNYSESPMIYQIRYIKYDGSSWGSIQNLTSNEENQTYPRLIYANYPEINNAKINIPKTGYAFVWTSYEDTEGNKSLVYYASTDLEWQSGESKPTTEILTPDKTQFRTVRKPSLQFEVTDTQNRNLNARVRYKLHSSNDCSGVDMSDGTILDSSTNPTGWSNNGVYTNTSSGTEVTYNFPDNLDKNTWYCFQAAAKPVDIAYNNNNDNKLAKLINSIVSFVDNYLFNKAYADDWGDWTDPIGFESGTDSFLTNLSDTLSREKSSEYSSHTIKFTTPSGVLESNKAIAITFPADFDTTSVDYTDIKLSHGPTTGLENEETLASSPTDTAWGALFGGDNNRTLALVHPTNNDNGDIPTNSVVVVRISTTQGDNQIKNTTTGGNKIIVIAGSFGDYGELAVPIIGDDQVLVTASIDPSLSFTISETNVYFGNITSSQARYATPGTEGSPTPPSNGAFMIQSISTNSANGLTLTTQSTGDGTTNAGLYSQVLSSLIEAKSISDVQTPDNTNGYAFAAKDASSTIGTLSIISGFQSETGTEIITRTPKTFATSTEPLSNAQVKVDLKLKISGLTPAGVYSDIITIICTGNY